MKKQELVNMWEYNIIAQTEFGMDYDELGNNEKEWVRDEYDNMQNNQG